MEEKLQRAQCEIQKLLDDNYADIIDVTMSFFDDERNGKQLLVQLHRLKHTREAIYLAKDTIDELLDEVE